MKTYHGYRQHHVGHDGEAVSLGCVVEVHDEERSYPLPPRNDIRDHSPTGFEWGFAGSGPAQLALALVADACGRRLAISSIYQKVKFRLVAHLPHDGWTLSEQQVVDAVLQAVSETEATAKPDA